MQTVKEEDTLIRKDAGRLADFIMFTQRSFLLNLSKELNKGNVSFAQFFLLGYLANENFLTMTDISKKMGHSTAAATGLVDRLEKLGYVQRLHASEDRRKVMVQITRKGIDLVDRMREDITGTTRTSSFPLTSKSCSRRKRSGIVGSSRAGDVVMQ